MNLGFIKKIINTILKAYLFNILLLLSFWILVGVVHYLIFYKNVLRGELVSYGLFFLLLLIPPLLIIRIFILKFYNRKIFFIILSFLPIVLYIFIFIYLIWSFRAFNFEGGAFI